MKDFEPDKIPPQDIDLEKYILGAIIVEPGQYDILERYLKPETFYLVAHQTIYQALMQLKNNGSPIDLIILVNYLREIKKLDEVGGAYYITTLTSQIVASTNIETYAKKLAELFIKREIIRLSHESINKVYDNIDIVEIYSTLINSLDGLFTMKISDNKPIADIMNDRLNDISLMEPGKIIGVTSGVNSVDTSFGGWQDSDMITLAARPSMGKTAVSLLFAKAPIFKQKRKVLYFSLEMPGFRLADRILSLETGINSELLQNANLTDKDWLQLSDIAEKYQGANLIVNDQSGLTIEEIRSISILESRKSKVDLIIIDYLQLIGFTFKDYRSTNDQVSHISKNIKMLAKKLNIPVIALSQLSREVEKRSNKRPELSDLRDSGSIEQDSDFVLFLYRDEYYNSETTNKNEIELIIRKNRNGRIGTDTIYKNDNWSYISDKPYSEWISERIPEF